jgi:hypothetical protein
MLKKEKNNNVNTDLIWNLDGISNQDEAFQFLKLFENRLFVYSFMVEKIYTSYSFILPQKENHQIAVLPDHKLYHDIFHNISNDAVQNTNIAIFPGDVVGQKNIVIKLPKQQYTTTKILPLKEGIAFIYALYKKQGKTFLPVISNGDLKEYKNRMPCLYLHNINTIELKKHIAPYQIKSIENSVYDSLKKMITDYREV